MDKGLRPIPALYVCYLLRSTIRHSALYVGSTPDPVRRLKQHNGVSKGGAVRTSRETLQPWEVTCLVTGFPSKIAALQFEWAWQNTHLTRHIAADTRFTQAKAKTRISPRTGRVRRRTVRPRLSLTDRIANLQLLLQACSFERWPLKVTFYVQDVYKMWQRWVAKHPSSMAPHVEIFLDPSALVEPPADSVVDEPATVPNGLSALTVDYAGVKAHLEKSRSMFSNGTARSCAVCKQAVSTDGTGALLCSGAECSMVSHIDCLSRVFLQANPSALVPTEGHCPKCEDKLNWLELVRELSLRMRGEAEVTKLFKLPRTSKKKAAADQDEDVLPGAEDDDLSEDGIWHNLSQSSMDIDELVTPEKSTARKVNRPQVFKATSNQQIIEDSDWDDAEVLT